MSIVEFFEILANSAHYQVDINDLLKNQPEAFKAAVLANHASDIKSMLGSNEVLADKSTIFLT